MPKYRDKMRLKGMPLKKGTVDPMTRHLVLAGYTDDEVAEGLERFVSIWEESVQIIKEDGPHAVSEEYHFEVFQRCYLHDVLQHALPEQIEPFRKRIEEADRMFKEVTEEIETPFAGLADKPDREIHWWLFRRPK